MQKIILLSCFINIILLTACNNNTQTQNSRANTKDSIGKVELYDSSAKDLIDTNAHIEIIGRNYTWCEGPVWVPSKQMLLFSDVPNDKIYKWVANDTPVVYLDPSGYTGTTPRGGEKGSNGLTLDNKGRLLICQDGNRQIARMNAPLDSPKAAYTSVTSNYTGKKYNSPNDIVVSNNGTIYFTDPIYGLEKGANDPLRELKFEGVYEVDSSGKTTLLIDSISRPNGIALSPDEKILYVGSSDDVHTKWYAYDLDANGNITKGKVLFDGTELKANATVKQGADGFKIDNNGNIFSAGPDGINIISSQGKLLGLIRIYNKRVSNCAFNENKDMLYVTATDVVLKIKLH
jgi:gluconolactonase